MNQNEIYAQIKEEYTKGIVTDNNEHIFPTLKQLSLKYGVDYHYLQQISYKNHWGRLRRIDKAKTNLKRSILEQEAKTAVEDITWTRKMKRDVLETESIIRALLKHIKEKIEEEEQYPSPMQIEKLTYALLKLHHTGDDVFNMHGKINKKLEEENKKLREQAKKIIVIERGKENRNERTGTD